MRTGCVSWRKKLLRGNLWCVTQAQARLLLLWGARGGSGLSRGEFPLEAKSDRADLTRTKTEGNKYHVDPLPTSVGCRTADETLPGDKRVTTTTNPHGSLAGLELQSKAGPSAV
jgi:hypothetical protein